MLKTLPGRADKESRCELHFCIMKFESLSLEKFGQNAIEKTEEVIGGENTTPVIPDGGAVCDTAGGVHPVVGFEYESDSQVYNADGSLGEKEYHQ